MKIEILGMGCPKCKKLFENTQQAVQELGIKRKLLKLKIWTKFQNME